MTDSSKKRIKVLEYSLTLELLSSFSLAYLLDIDSDKIKDSKSLGNSSSSLSFNQKVNLLLDNKSITKEEKLKLESFMNIRNQFMHNKDADSYCKAVKLISGLENRLKKIYPKLFEETETEIALEKCVSKLFSDGMSILAEFKGGKGKKMEDEAERIVYKKKYYALLKSLKTEIERVYNDVKNHKLELIEKEELASTIDLLKYEIITKMNVNYEED